MAEGLVGVAADVRKRRSARVATSCQSKDVAITVRKPSELIVKKRDISSGNYALDILKGKYYSGVLDNDGFGLKVEIV